MILLSKLHGEVFALNPDLIEQAEATPDTVLTLIDGKKVIVAESIAEVIERAADYRASVLTRVRLSEADKRAGPVLHVVPGGQNAG